MQELATLTILSMMPGRAAPLVSFVVSRHRTAMRCWVSPSEPLPGCQYGGVRLGLVAARTAMGIR
ncbi:MAG TPA: hypothetical protein VMK13_00060 [Streptosporangiaceae bacterium]|nr:hypothetical protein [Streptosporangiaceae bacterium]